MIDNGAMQPTTQPIETVETSAGPARVHWDHQPPEPGGLVVLGPGASGAVQAVDLLAATAVAGEMGLAAARVEPAYRVAGRKVPPRGPAADDPWLQVVEALRTRWGRGPLVVGGRSFGSRVAARTAHAAGADAVLALAYPLHPPGRPEKSRLEELEAAQPLPTLVISGRTDPFGRPESGGSRRVVLVPGDHSLRRGLDDLVPVVRHWLAGLVDGPTPADATLPGQGGAE